MENKYPKSMMDKDKEKSILEGKIKNRKFQKPTTKFIPIELHNSLNIVPFLTQAQIHQ